jgi:hypothetical protein
MYYTKYNLRAPIRSTQRKRENLGVCIDDVLVVVVGGGGGDGGDDDVVVTSS